MNANEIWSGTDYAHTDYISRGVLYYPNANRVKVLRVFKKKLNGNTRDTTLVDVLVMNYDGQSVKQINRWVDGEYRLIDYERTVRAREIFMRWEEYEIEDRRRKEERERAEIDRNESNARARGFADYATMQAHYEKERIEREERIKREKEEREAKRLEQIRLQEEERERQLKEDRNVLVSLKAKGISEDAVISLEKTKITIDRTKLERWLGLVRT